MRTKHSSLILLLLISLDTYSQELQPVDSAKWLCIYNYEFLQDSTSKYSLKNDQMYLLIGSHLSKYNCVTHYITDSVTYLNQGKNVDMRTVAMMNIKSISGVSSSIMSLYDIYKNYPRKGLMSFIAFDDRKFFKVEQPMEMTWKLDTQKDTIILGYPCQKAYTTYAGRNYIAWYSPQIPIPDGPYKFNGLPGLILKIYDTKNQHCFTLISIKKVNNIRTINFHLNNYIDITAEEYIKIMRNKLVRLYGNLQSGSIPINSEEAKSAAMYRLKGQNNFIEIF